MTTNDEHIIVSRVRQCFTDGRVSFTQHARFLLPGGGTSEILRLVISRDLAWDRATVFGGDAP